MYLSITQVSYSPNSKSLILMSPSIASRQASFAPAAPEAAWPRVTIVSVNYRQPTLTGLMLLSLQQATYPDLEIIVVDNGSGAQGVQHLEAEFPAVQFLYSADNLGFAGGNNLAFPHATGDYVLLLNNDTEVPPDFLQPMVRMMEADRRIGVVSPKLYFYDQPDTLQYAGTTRIHPITSRGRKFGHGEVDQGQHDQVRETGYANGACLLIRRKLLEQAGYLREDYFLYYEEHDLTERVRQAGFRIMYQPESHIYHKVSASTGALSPLKAFYLHRNRLVFIRRTQRGLTKGLALLYYLLVATPKAWLGALRHPERRKAIERAVWQGIKGEMSRF